MLIHSIVVISRSFQVSVVIIHFIIILLIEHITHKVSQSVYESIINTDAIFYGQTA